jgi:hypothetical protein
MLNSHAIVVHGMSLPANPSRYAHRMPPRRGLYNHAACNSSVGAAAKDIIPVMSASIKALLVDPARGLLPLVVQTYTTSIGYVGPPGPPPPMPSPPSVSHITCMSFTWTLKKYIRLESNSSSDVCATPSIFPYNCRSRLYPTFVSPVQPFPPPLGGDEGGGSPPWLPVAIVIPAVAALLLIASVVVYEVRNSRKHRNLWGKVLPPGPGPDTSILVAEVQVKGTM